MRDYPDSPVETGNSSWYGDRNFWLTFAPVLFGNERWCLAPMEAEQVIRTLSLKDGNRLLDSCCGVGRHSVEFSVRGLDVTGVDLLDEYLDAARETAEAMETEIDFVQADMRRFIRENYFDAAVNMFISVGYFEEERDEICMFDNIRRSLKEGGTFLVDTIGREILRVQFREKEWYRENGIFVISEYGTNPEFSILRNRWILYDDTGRHEYSFSHRVYSAEELTGLLRKAGFRRIDIYGDLDGSSYGPESNRLVAVATS